MNHDTEHQLRELIRNVIREELKSREVKKDAETGITTSDLEDKEGKKVGYMKHKELPTGGFVAGGRIGPKAAEKKVDETSHEPEYNKDAVDKAIASSKEKVGGAEAKAIHRLLKGRHNKAPKKSVEDRARELGQIEMFEEKLRKAVMEKMEKTDENKYSLPAGTNKPKEPVQPKSPLEKRFGHLKPGESASLKGDPKDVKKPVKESNTLIDKMEKTGTPKSDDKDIYSLVFGKKRPHGKGSKSVEDKAREMGQIDMFTLEEWIGMLEEAGYAIRENEGLKPK